MIENIKYKVADVAKDLKLPVKDVLDTLGVLHGAAAKFLYDEAHWVFTFFLSRGGVSPGPGTGPGRTGTGSAPPGRSP